MRVLILSPFFPYPTDSGGKMRLYSLVKELSADHDITLLSLIDERDLHHQDRLNAFCRYEPVAVRTRGGRWGRVMSRGRMSNVMLRLAAVSKGTPPMIAKFIDWRMLDRLQHLTNGERYDIVHLEYIQMGCYRDYVPADTATVVSAVELVSVAASRETSKKRGAVLRRRIASRWLRQYETSLFQATDAVLSMSETDSAMVAERCPAANVFLVPNGIDADLVSVQRNTPSTPMLLFVGGVAHSPNVDALSFFLSGECWPKLRQEFPDIRLRVVGNGWRTSDHIPSDSSIELVDYVDDLRESYGCASLLIAPIRIGSGTRLKILEAMAAGLPVVSTTIGCEGLQVADGRELVIADDAAAFCRSVSGLLREPMRAAQLAKRARSHVFERFRWSQSADLQSAAYEQVLRRRAGDRP